MSRRASSLDGDRPSSMLPRMGFVCAILPLLKIIVEYSPALFWVRLCNSVISRAMLSDDSLRSLPAREGGRRASSPDGGGAPQPSSNGFVSAISHLPEKNC